jgi:hypothetical protein
LSRNFLEPADWFRSWWRKGCNGLQVGCFHCRPIVTPATDKAASWHYMHVARSALRVEEAGDCANAMNGVSGAARMASKASLP